MSTKDIEWLMSKKVLNYRETESFMKRLGFKLIHQKGTHEMWKHEAFDEPFQLIYKNGQLGYAQFQDLKKYIDRLFSI